MNSLMLTDNQAISNTFHAYFYANLFLLFLMRNRFFFVFVSMF